MLHAYSPWLSAEGGTRRAGTSRRLDLEVYSPLRCAQLQEHVFLEHDHRQTELEAVNLPPAGDSDLGQCIAAS